MCGTLWHSNMFHNVSNVLCVTGTILLRPCQKMSCSVRGRRSTLHVSIFMLQGRCSTLEVWCCVFFANCIARAVSSVDNLQICVAGVGYRECVLLGGMRSIWRGPVVCAVSFCMAGAVFGTLYTLHLPLATTLSTLHYALYTLHPARYTLHFSRHTLHFSLYTCHSPLYTVHSALYTLYSTLHTLDSMLCTPHSTLYTPHFLRFTLYTSHSAIPTSYTLRTTFYAQDPNVFTIHTLHSNPFHTPQSTLVR